MSPTERIAGGLPELIFIDTLNFIEKPATFLADVQKTAP